MGENGRNLVVPARARGMSDVPVRPDREIGTREEENQSGGKTTEDLITHCDGSVSVCQIYELLFALFTTHSLHAITILYRLLLHQ